LAKVASGAFADNACVPGRERRDFRGLRSDIECSGWVTPQPRKNRNAAGPATSHAAST